MDISRDIIKSKALLSLNMRNIREISIGNEVNVCFNRELVYAIAVVEPRIFVLNLELWKTHTLGAGQLVELKFFSRVKINSVNWPALEV